MQARSFGSVTPVLPTRELDDPGHDRTRRYDRRIATTPETSGEPTGTLRGAGVEADFRRVGRIALALGLVALAVVAVGLFVTGARKNAQITELRDHGMAVEVTVSACQGLLGGSGSNPAGYACRGTYVVGGRRYDEAIPGTTLYAPGTVFRAVTVRSDPELLSTVGAVAHDRASWRVYVVPTVLAVVLAGLLLALWRRRRLLRRS
jgi:hypothetical protein